MPDSSAQVVTRFAPSPTGALHVGGARTALFNWAFARGRGGRFILRIEDTDRARSTPEATAGILRDLAWLGMDWDEGPDPGAESWDDGQSQSGNHGPYFQSQRLDLYRQHLDRLIADDRAYEDDGAYRFRMPAGDITLQDQVLGKNTVKAGLIDDFVIMKSDGYPTYHLAVVVDDALMGVTHVIRGQEHLNNAPKHVALQDALGFDRPKYAHIPLIFNSDGSKMSKRDKAKVARKAAIEHIQQLQNSDEWIHDLHELASSISETLTGEPTRITETKINELIHGLARRPDWPNLGERMKAFVGKENDEVEIAELIAYDLKIKLPEIDVVDYWWNGYLPGPMVNYLALLGWNPGRDVEHYGADPLRFVQDQFSFDRVQRSNAGFDRDKLLHFNTEAIAAMSPDEFRRAMYRRSNLLLNAFKGGEDDPRFVCFAKAYHGRAHTLREPQEIGRFFFVSDLDIDYTQLDKKARKVMEKNDGQALAVLRDLRDKLDAIAEGDWTAKTIDAAVKAYAEEKGLGMGAVAQPLRVAVSGGTVSPGIDETLLILGRPKTLNRIDLCLLALDAPR